MRILFATAMAAALLAGPALAQTQPPALNVPPVIPDAPKVIVEHAIVHGVSLEGNLEGDSPDRDLIVYLPPDYYTNKTKRYPVVYALHGYSISNEKWTTEIRTPQTVEGAFATGTKGMIVVLPNAQTLHNGSMYSNSATTGNWERFIAVEVVHYIAAHYRTLADRDSRGLAGHSMGGYGTVRIGMKYPDVFGSLYIMSPCCLSARKAFSPETEAKFSQITTIDQSKSLSFGDRATFASAAAWSPNPQKPPFYFDLPIGSDADKAKVLARWAANAPLAMVDQYIFNLRQYHAIAMDVGDQDGLRVDAGELHRILDSYGIANSFEIYSGTHISAVADRFQNHVLPFFSQNLSFEARKK
ncbi:MAG TPA: alpha/beta hydrolase-fold protein [Asticcacaulis sp.]|nr:alpha/beta hydrolase-fold protein [Asticcacaulis sp.]